MSWSCEHRMHKAALGGCEGLQNGVRESEGVGLGMWSSATWSVGFGLDARVIPPP
jgi:hypothetical protein